MNVTGWTIDQRMRLPDWCFGNREVYGCEVICTNKLQFYWAISAVALPDPCCIWQVLWWFKMDTRAMGAFRIGLRATVPTSEAEMNDAVEILPNIGEVIPGPNRIRFAQDTSNACSFDLRKGMVTGGLKLVAEVWNDQDATRGDFMLTVSGLPTNMAGWLAHNPV